MIKCLRCLRAYLYWMDTNQTKCVAYGWLAIISILLIKPKCCEYTFLLIGNYQQPSTNTEAGGSMSGAHSTHAADGHAGKLYIFSNNLVLYTCCTPLCTNINYAKVWRNVSEHNCMDSSNPKSARRTGVLTIQTHERRIRMRINWRFEIYLIKLWSEFCALVISCVSGIYYLPATMNTCWETT